MSCVDFNSQFNFSISDSHFLLIKLIFVILINCPIRLHSKINCECLPLPCSSLAYTFDSITFPVLSNLNIQVPSTVPLQNCFNYKLSGINLYVATKLATKSDE